VQSHGPQVETVGTVQQRVLGLQEALWSKEGAPLTMILTQRMNQQLGRWIHDSFRIFPSKQSGRKDTINALRNHRYGRRKQGSVRV
jgi:hypothetical protein